ncbi:MAG: YopX family protein [Thermincolia bacterium]
MREYKFRAWLPDYQGMFYSNENGETEEEYWSFGLNGKIIVSTLEIIDRMTGGYHDQSEGYVEHGNAIFMQYTEISDRKRTEEFPEGQEIYEDDICRYSYISPLDGEEKEYLWRVEYANGMYWLRHVESKYDVPLYIKASLIEVISNIYENPELLEGK